MAEGKPQEEFDGELYVRETWLRADLAIIKAWRADSEGNLQFRKTARNFNPVMATAATTTVVEVEEMVEVGEIDPDCVHTPGIYVQRIVQKHDQREAHREADGEGARAMRLSRRRADVALAAWAGAAAAGREPVLKQVDLPHSYYWRELYIPQLTTGPSSAAFTPDGKTLVYSMGGSLWRQAIGSDEAFELTHPRAAYDYQPDVAPDGKSVVFTRYDGDALELWRLDLATGREQQLTSGDAVNVEPRLSPDGKRIAWVSTQGTGHFNLFIADIGPDGLRNARPLLGERQSKIPRYYYSAFDHALNPSWTPDGKRILYVTNQ